MTRSPSATPQATRLYLRAIFPCLAHPSSHEDVHLSIWLWHAKSQQFRGAKMPRVLSEVWDTAVMPQSLSHVGGFRGVCHLFSAQTQGIAKSPLIPPSPLLARFLQMVGANISPSLGKNNNGFGAGSGVFALSYGHVKGCNVPPFLPWASVYWGLDPNFSRKKIDGL